MSVAVFGSAFDPPHRGHADVVSQLLDRHQRVLLVPAAAHGFGKRMSCFEQRMALVKGLVTEMFSGQSQVEVRDIERHLLAQQPSRPVYSIDLLEALRAEMPGQPLALVLGPDNARKETFERFWRWQDIASQFTIDVVEERLPIHSSQVRALCSEQGYQRQALRELCGEAVAELIMAMGLYR